MAVGDWLGDISALTGISGAAHSYVRGAVISAGIRAGQSANEILRGLSSVGVGVRRDQGLSIIAAERQRQSAGATANQVPLGGDLGELLGAPPPAGWTGQYVHQVTAISRSRDEEGNYITHTRTLGIKSGRLLAPNEAISSGFDILNQTTPEGTATYLLDSGSLVSLSLSGVWYDTQNRNLPTV